MGLIFFESDQKITKKHCRADLSRVSYPLTCWLSISVLIRGFWAFKYLRFFQSIISVRNHLWGSTFFWKYSKFYVDSGNAEKNWQKIFGFQITTFELVPLNIRFYWENILVIRCQSGKKDSQDFRHFQKSVYRADFLWEWSKNITKTPLCRFKQRFGPFNMLTVKKCSDMVFFGLLSNSAFSSL